MSDVERAWCMKRIDGGVQTWDSTTYRGGTSSVQQGQLPYNVAPIENGAVCALWCLSLQNICCHLLNVQSFLQMKMRTMMRTKTLKMMMNGTTSFLCHSSCPKQKVDTKFFMLPKWYSNSVNGQSFCCTFRCLFSVFINLCNTSLNL